MGIRRVEAGPVVNGPHHHFDAAGATAGKVNWSEEERKSALFPVAIYKSVARVLLYRTMSVTFLVPCSVGFHLVQPSVADTLTQADFMEFFHVGQPVDSAAPSAFVAI